VKLADPAEATSPCPSCGSTARLVEVVVGDSATLHDSLRTRRRREGSKPYLETESGDSLYRSSGEWNTVERRIDRENDLYYEDIKDAEGNPIRHVEEELSQHQCHGAAKRTVKQPPAGEATAKEAASQDEEAPT
jgi:hypothetical protein